MKFNTTSFDVSTKVNKNGGEQVTRLTLTGCEVDDAVIASSLISGQSPRVRLQNGFRANGIPKETTMTWAEYITPGRQPKVVIAETPEQVAERANKDPEYRKMLLEQLGLVEEVEDQETE